ncbi:MAG TPA: hypothetical protein VL501_05165 [Pyrinomonadaceae bacterium]|nr:hypothetical protein [Pyrinomonadaceae bacterium]
MKRILVLGSGGAGKTTFSQRLGERTGIPVVHLDALFWKPGWTRTPDDEWAEILRVEVSKPAWIMDGNYGSSRRLRLDAADTVILLDMPRWLCMWRVLSRTARYYGRGRPDMAGGCVEKFDLEFIAWVWTYKNRSRKRVMNDLSTARDKRIVILRSRADVENFLKDPYANPAG